MQATNCRSNAFRHRYKGSAAMTESNESIALAHVAGSEEDRWRTHALADHLSEVARLAAHFAQLFDAHALAHLAGLWPDLGKYSGDFQAYILNPSGFQPLNSHGNGK